MHDSNPHRDEEGRYAEYLLELRDDLDRIEGRPRHWLLAIVISARQSAAAAILSSIERDRRRPKRAAAVVA